MCSGGVHNRPDENRWNKPLNPVKCVSLPISVTIELQTLLTCSRLNEDCKM